MLVEHVADRVLVRHQGIAVRAQIHLCQAQRFLPANQAVLRIQRMLFYLFFCNI
jgi:hypothetical protein